MEYINDKAKLIHSRQLAKNNISELNWLRLRIIFVINFVFIVLLIPAISIAILFGDFNSNDFISTALTFLSILALVFSNMFIVKGYLKYPILITVLFVPLLCFVLVFLEMVPYQSMFPQLCLLLAYNIWILNNYKTRIYYSVIYFGFLFQLFYLYNSLAETISVMLVILGYIIVFHILSLFLERQDQRLFNSLKDQKGLNKTLVNKNNELQTFSHIMSHDLKTPLRNINSFSQLIKQEVKFENKNHKQYFTFIENSVGEMKTLIEELLLYHNVESEVINFVIINLSDIVDEISLRYQNELNKNTISIKSTPLPSVNGSYILLIALFGNLISNSVKYQPKENHVPKIELWSSTDSADYIEIYISDNGIGIDEKYIKNLFVPFKKFHTSQEYEGTGLGMSICKSVMEKHLGSILLHETSEKGTIFKLIFPKTPS